MLNLFDISGVANKQQRHGPACAEAQAGLFL